MFLFALLATATLHEPVPEDVHRFGFSLRPVTDSPARNIWLACRDGLQNFRSSVTGYVYYGRESEAIRCLEELEWLERVWDAVDDMARDCCTPECRRYAAKRLQKRLGVVLYWLGDIPVP